MKLETISFYPYMQFPIYNTKHTCTNPPNFGGGGGRPQPAGQNDFSPANFAGETHFARIPRAAGSWDAGEMREKFCGSPAAAGKHKKFSMIFPKNFLKGRFFSPATSLNFRGVFVHV